MEGWAAAPLFSLLTYPPNHLAKESMARVPQWNGGEFEIGRQGSREARL